MADCEKCHGPAPIKGKVGFCPPKVVQINNPQGPTLFHCVTVPASMGDDTTYPPKPGMYKNILLYYEANDQVYLYSSDGIPTRLTIDITDIKKQLADLEEGLDAETDAREAADTAIWEEIEEIEMSSDVVDIVGTYAELQQYDTSKLHDNDIIKVLQDETHDNETAYYRWSTATDTFSYVGSEGPYYTESEVDTLLSGKQNTLIAGANITIDANSEISAVDTTYTHFTGATASTDGVQGLVPGPLAGDEDKVLKGDGTWGGVATLETSSSSSASETSYDYYVESADGRHRLGLDIEVNRNTGDIDNAYLYLDDTYPVVSILPAEMTQEKLIAGTNISIAADGKTISATDTTYSAFTGTDGQTAGVAGLVPAPATTDAGKFLKADGTWANASYSDFVGATAQQAGVHGLVPAPTTSDTDKFLKGDGTWAAETTYSTGTSSTSGITKLYDQNGQNADGAVTQKHFTDVVGDVEAALQILNSGAGVP